VAAGVLMPIRKGILNRLLTYLLLCFALEGVILAQKPDFYIGFDQILDNREYFTSYADHHTMFGARIDPGLTFRFDSVHTLCTGINYMYEYGGELLGVKPQLDLYYKYQDHGVELRLGSFPRREVLDYPLMLLTDTLYYYRPNMEGASVLYRWDRGMVHARIDWTGRETAETREAILAGIDATIRAGIFYFTALTTRYHLARTTEPSDGFRLHDDGSIGLFAGLELKEKTMFHRLDLSAGWVPTYVRDRPAGFEWTRGWLSRFKARYHILGLKASWYLGDAPPLVYGDPLYHSGNYGRFDPFLNNPRIRSKISWNFHVIPGDGLYHSQQVLITVSL